MNSELILGNQVGDDTYIGRINVHGIQKGILLSPKAIRQLPEPVIWNGSYNSVADALSFCDGYNNTIAMAKAGSEFAQWALDHNMHIPSLDEWDIIYRATKPTTQTNALYSRSGVNVSAIPPTYPYTADNPQQTTLEQFQEGGPEAFDTHDWYWSSTQHAFNEGCAWAQNFNDGGQLGLVKSDECLGCAVRWIDL